MAANLYLHFPFCRRKCSYCALHSRAGVSAERRSAYVRNLADEISHCPDLDDELSTVYFGGGTPALCDLAPLFDAISRKRRNSSFEFTVELHPLDVNRDLLHRLRDGGVNRISMGVQSLDDAILADMGRGYDFSAAERAFAEIRECFDNAGIDLIVGYPGEERALSSRHARLAKWGLAHCSVYSLILEERSILAHRKIVLPSDDVVMDILKIVASFMHELGLERYEISNYALPGRECKHNLAVWRGEDYVGLGEGAHGRIGRKRTNGAEVEEVSPRFDEDERLMFQLRTRDGLDAATRPEWLPTLRKFVAEGLLAERDSRFVLTERGTEVCDSILSAL